MTVKKRWIQTFWRLEAQKTAPRMTASRPSTTASLVISAVLAASSIGMVISLVAGA